MLRSATRRQCLFGGKIPGFIADAVRHMAGRHHLARPLAMTGLVIKKYIRSKGFEKGRFIQPAQKKRFIQTNVPVTQRADHPFMGRRLTGSDQRSANRAVVIGELTLQQV